MRLQTTSLPKATKPLVAKHRSTTRRILPEYGASPLVSPDRQANSGESVAGPYNGAEGATTPDESETFQRSTTVTVATAVLSATPSKIVWDSPTAPIKTNPLAKTPPMAPKTFTAYRVPMQWPKTWWCRVPK